MKIEFKNTKYYWIYGHIIIFAICLIIFRDLVWAKGVLVIGDQSKNPSTDLFYEFLHLRKFGFSELFHGNLAFWNPHVYSGAPFYGTFQPALLYPLNWIFLVLPLAQAINLSIAMHVFLMGAFTYCWALRRDLHPTASILTGVMVMLSGPFFLHIYAGHLSNLSSMAWIPALFICVDEILKPTFLIKNGKYILKWILLTSSTLAMQIISGHPQYVYYTCIAAAIYCSLQLARHPEALQTTFIFLIIAIFAIALSAIQLFPGIQANSETLRSAPLTLEFASLFSLPPESLLTTFSPWILGKLPPSQYYGRWYLWEMSLFIGVTGTILALSGIAHSLRLAYYTQAKRMFYIAPALTLIFLIALALGANTYFFEYFFNYIPGYNRFRGTAKFGIYICIFLSLFAGISFDQNIKYRKTRFGEVYLALFFSIISLSLLSVTSYINWIAFIQTIYTSGQTFFPSELFVNQSTSERLLLFANFAHNMVNLSLFKIGATSAIISLSFLLLRKTPRAIWLIGFLALSEMIWFAMQATEHFNMQDSYSEIISEYLRDHAGEYRIANIANPSSSMTTGAFDISGNDPSIVLRYAEFMAFAEGKSPENPTHTLGRILPLHLYSLLRLKYIFSPLENGGVQVVTNDNPLQRFTLISNYKIVPDRDSIFGELSKSDFDPKKIVILEKPPNPPPISNAIGNAHLLSETTDSLIIEVDVDRASILLMSDTYSRYWKAESMQGSDQLEYAVQPANYILRAIPLAKGHHKIKLQYYLSSFVPSLIISGIAWLAAISLSLVLVKVYKP